MKILYLAQTHKVINTYSESKEEYDLEHTGSVIREAILNNFQDTEVEYASDVMVNDDDVSERIKEFDFCICDLTANNGNYTYLAGLSEGLGKPVIYFCTSDHAPMYILREKNVLQYSIASLENEFKEKLIETISRCIKDPSAFISESITHTERPKAFISYSHKDKKYLDRLLTHLKPLERNGMLDVWQDTQIKTGDKWKEKIDGALNEASIAILLLSADFMASDFIIENELPPILSGAEVNGTKIVPVILSHCRFSREPTLNRFQAVNPPSEPLSILSSEEREAIYDKLASDIELALNCA